MNMLMRILQVSVEIVEIFRSHWNPFDFQAREKTIL